LTLNDVEVFRKFTLNLTGHTISDIFKMPQNARQITCADLGQ